MLSRGSRLLVLMLAATVGALSCCRVPTVVPTFYVTSVSDARRLGSGSCRAFTTDPQFRTTYTYIMSGPPEYLRVTLRRLTLRGEFSDGSREADLWVGSYAMTLDGSHVDTSDLETELLPIPTGRVTSLQAEFDPVAMIKGAVSGQMGLSDGATSEFTAYTKADYFYDEPNHTGGADSYLAFAAGPAEETRVWWVGTVANDDLDTTVSEDLPPPTLTLVFDLDRVLRFYNGQHLASANGGVDPPDPADRAYFFAHTFMPAMISVGLPGSIEGYEATYAAYGLSDPVGGTTPDGVRAWMTLIFDQEGAFQAGQLIGDDDNALTVAKGYLSAYEPVPDGTVRFSYHEGFEVVGFRRGTAIGEVSPTCLFTGPYAHGEASFTMRLTQ